MIMIAEQSSDDNDVGGRDEAGIKDGRRKGVGEGGKDAGRIAGESTMIN